MQRREKRVFITERPVFKCMCECGVKDHLLGTGQKADQPHYHAGDPGIAEVPHCAQGVHHCKVPVKGQQSQEEDRAIDAQVVHASDQLAHEAAEDPGGELHVDGHEGKAAHEDGGGQDQVEQQDVGHCGQLLKPGGMKTETEKLFTGHTCQF